MAWTEQQPGHWRRPMGENESMIKMIGDRGHDFGKDVWSIAATARFAAHLGSKPTAQALREGWKALRFRHPSIAATADGDGLLHYHVLDAREQDRWADETFVVLSDEEVSFDHIIRTLAPRHLPVCYYLMSQESILLHLSHWRTDGIGAFQLLGALFSATVELSHAEAQLPWGEEVVRLVPSVEEALELPSTPTTVIKEASQKYLATLSNNIGALSIPPQPGAGKAPTCTRTRDVRLPAEQTAEVLSACARLGIRVESAIHASVATAAYAIADPASAAHTHHSSTLRHSIRPHLPPPYDGVAGAAGLYTAGYIVKVPATAKTWLDRARFLEPEYERGATPDLLCSRREYARAMKTILSNMAPTDPPPSGLDVSWIPDAQDHVGVTHSSGGYRLRVREVGLSVEVLSRHVYVFACIFDGRLQLRVGYNESFYDQTFADRVLALVVGNLVPVRP
ncbi:hypothetical protein GGR56DRAFT_684194 [Xylariaceae sp. FL0804]|nr:hypothetical protein GGR56DRAFT_684194 [Xylariaceae sp. FL0804]